ncbi:MAG: ECF transporter S component, partial [Firmicutes bacterium]|nr:ECF transporter S component [Bacillota bacterium]
GAAAWAPWTLVIKAGMAMILGLILKLPTKTDKAVSFREILGMILATVFMTGGYYLAEGVMYGNWMAPMVGVPWNLLQGAVGTVIASALSIALKNRRLLN